MVLWGEWRQEWLALRPEASGSGTAAILSPGAQVREALAGELPAAPARTAMDSTELRPVVAS